MSKILPWLLAGIAGMVALLFAMKKIPGQAAAAAAPAAAAAYPPPAPPAQTQTALAGVNAVVQGVTGAVGAVTGLMSSLGIKV
ncbi:MAG: hypothetical protein ABII76_25445 [Pseudomonadota bacterium]